MILCQCWGSEAVVEESGGEKKTRTEEGGSKTSAGAHSRDGVVITVRLGAGIFNVKRLRS